MITVTIPLALRNPLNERSHWAVKAKRAKKQCAVVGWLLKASQAWSKLPAAHWPLVVTMTRVYTGRSKAMDDDGLSAAFKHVRDAIAAYMGVDDADPRILFRCTQERGPKASKACVRIGLEVVQQDPFVRGILERGS